MTDTRFAFGKNWTDYARRHMTPDAVTAAQKALLELLRLPSLAGLRVLDIGCGSGIHSLAAHLAGAREVVSFDYDADSVSISRAVHAQHGASATWSIMQGSVLDEGFMQALGRFDLVYSWGVLHHTGDMMTAMRHAARAVNDNGLWALALYSHTAYQNNTVFGQPTPEEWLSIKQNYVEGNARVKRRLILQYIWRRYFAGAGANPFALAACARDFFTRWFRYAQTSRGMDFFTDIKDWVGGWPMEFMAESDCLAFAREAGLELLRMQTGRGNTEYLFRPKGAQNHWDAILAKREATVLAPPFAQIAPRVWQAEVPPHIPHDTPQDPFRSPLRMTEDGAAWGFAHCHREALEAFGKGRYRHEAARVLFATTDNTDPNANGRSYTWHVE